MLTDAFIRGANGGTHWDDTLKGFGIRVGKQAKTFVVLVGSGRRHKLGRYPHLSLSDARKEARRILAEKELGVVRPTHVAYDDAKREFLADCAKKNRPRTVEDHTRLLNRHLSFGRQSVGDIQPRQLIKIWNTLSGTPGEQRYAFVTARAFFRWCVRQHIIDRSPMEHMQVPARARPRERVLSDLELGKLWRATAGGGAYHSLVRLLILTGQRRGEIARMEWSWLADDLCTIPSSVTKNGRTHSVPLCPKALSILTKKPRLKDNPYVFPAQRQRSGKTTIINGWSWPKSILDKELCIESWTLHDLRRTFASGMASIGVPQIVVEKLLNHVSGGTQSPIAQVYNRYSYLPEMRAAVLQWDDHLDTLIAPRA